ncbi:MAG TPA: glycosyltransferase [Candidatus Angelobacter sp.]|nr:glycosyltransferase [Candidatus Angelobacter sp.]
MKRTRIIHVLHRMAAGGTELALSRVISGLDPQRFENIICTVAPAPVGIANGFHCISLNRTGRKTGSLVADFARLFRKFKPDIVHSRNWGAIEAVLAAKLARVPRVIHSEHGRDITTMNGDPWRRRVFRRFAYGLADEVFAVSRELREHYSAQVGSAKSRIGFVPNGVDTERFHADEEARIRMRSQLGISPTAFIAGTVGRLDPVKDHKTLLRAAELLGSSETDSHIVIVGGGPEHEMLRALIVASAALRGRVHLAGESAQPEHWLNAFDVFVLPSLSEGMSNTLLEAMATSLSCVVTNVGANPDLVDDGKSGYLVPVGDAKAIADRIFQLAIDPQLRARMGQRGRLKVTQEFSMARMLENYTRLYTLGNPLPVRQAALSRA